MNFTELIRLDNYLQTLSIRDIQQDSSHRFDTIMHKSDVPLANIDSIFRSALSDSNNKLQETFDHFEQNLNLFKHAVKTKIEKEGPSWLQQSYIRYEQQLETRLNQLPEAINLHKNKPMVLDTELEQMLRTRVGYYNSWLYPAMIIHPMLEPFIHDMLANDPLYVVDESRYLLDPVLKQFNHAYQSRLRSYVIEESFDYPLLEFIPAGQLGFCLAYNYLNYKPFEILKKYIEEIYKKLAPGGVFAFTFNDCDRYQAIQLVEQEITCYTPGSLVLGWIEYVGFELIYRYEDDNHPSSWIELRKPGQLSSLRGGQSLAKILPKPIAKSK